MSAGNCIKDSPTIDLAIVEGALEADVRISGDPDNDITTDGDGLFASHLRADVCKLVHNAAQNLISFNNASTASLNTAQFADPPAMASAAANRITIQRTGIYLVTAEAAFGAVNLGLYRAAGPYLTGYGYLPDLVMRYVGAVLTNFTAPATQDLTPQNAVLLYLTAGATIFLGYNQDSGGNISSGPVEDSGCSLSATLLVDLSS